MTQCMLWFDVGIKRYTTPSPYRARTLLLWFDVGIKRYTTRLMAATDEGGCGLM